MKKSDLRQIISGPTITKLAKGETVRTDVLDKICDFLNCQPSDIMEFTRTTKDSITGKKVEIADHTGLDYLPEGIRPEPDDINVYPSDEDSPYEKGYKRKLY